MQKVIKALFKSFQDILPQLTPTCLQKAAKKIKIHGNITDKDI